MQYTYDKKIWKTRNALSALLRVQNYAKFDLESAFWIVSGVAAKVDGMNG